MAQVTLACPVLPAPDPLQAAEWYADKLGFRILSIFPREGYAIVERDGIEIHFWRCKDRRIAENTSAYLRVDDIDGLHSTMTKVSDGGRISTVESQPWGIREFNVWDPNGNLLRFGARVAAEQAQ